MENVNKVVKTRCLGLMNSKKTFLDIFNVMFSTNDYILGEWNDGYKINSITYLEAKKKIFDLAYSINQKYPNLKDQYIGIAMESSIEWVLSFWAILASGNKPYLVNLRHPHELVNHLLKSLNVEYVIELDSKGYDAKGIPYLELKEEAKDFTPSFADEMALSTSATTLKEKIIFYNGLEISSQILNCKKILEENKQIKKHYKGRLKQLVFLPLYHIFGFMATYMWFSFFGRTMVFLKDYSKDTILYTIKKHEVTHLFAVPLFWNTIEKEILKGVKEKNKEKKFNKGLKLCIALQKVFPNYGIKKSKRIMHEVTDSLFGKSVLFCISGGSYIKEDTLRLINGLGYPLYNGYGMSEIGITSVELGSIKDRLKNSIGKPFESIQYEIKDNKLYVKGTSISHKMKINGEYVYNNDLYSTEDIVKKDKDNRYYILGRSDDLFIGPNGENINPDQIELLFHLPKSNRYSVLNIENQLTLVIEISKYLSKDTIVEIYKEACECNNKLDSSLRVSKIYFTYDPIQAETAIKVSRQYLLKQLENKKVTLVKIDEIKEKNQECLVNQEILDFIIKSFKEVLMVDTVSKDSNFFFDLGGTSLDYFSLISLLNQHFNINITFLDEKNYHTPLDLALEVERLLSL